jgi:hypothetical protein
VVGFKRVVMFSPLHRSSAPDGEGDLNMMTSELNAFVDL